MKDLPDLALIATAGAVEAGRLRATIDQTFGFRRTHDVPDRLPAPPDTWQAPTLPSQRKTSCGGRPLMRRSKRPARSSIQCSRASPTADGIPRAGRGAGAANDIDQTHRRGRG